MSSRGEYVLILLQKPRMSYESYTLHAQLKTWPPYLPPSFRIKHFAQCYLRTLHPQTISPLFLHVTLNPITGQGLMSN